MPGSEYFCAWLVASAVLQFGSVMAQAPEYITVATAAASKNGGAVRAMNATIQVVLDSHSRPEISHGDHLTWTHGQTKVILRTTWAGTEGAPWRSSNLRVSTQACSDENVASASNAYGKSDRRLDWQLNDDGTVTKANGMTIVTHELSPQRIVMDRTNALCVVLVNAQNQPQLRAPLMPAAPDFPTSFHTGIEASITEKGYTFHIYESYSAECNAVMFSFHSDQAGYVRMLTDYKNNKMWQMFSPNSTYPKGVCTSTELDPASNLVAFEGNSLASSSRFLGFLSQSGAPAEYQPPASGFQELVRGVPVDEWMYKEAMRNNSNAADILGRYTVHLYFSSPEWHFGPSNGHRILQRVALKGRQNTENGTRPVTHSYDFVDFRPYIPPYITFEPCEMLPGGDGCECIDLGCTSVSPAGASFFTTPTGATVSADSTENADTADGAATVASATQCVDSHSGAEHDRELLGVWFFGLVLGVLCALAGVFITNRIRKKKLSAQLEQEAAYQQSASPAPETYAGFAGPTLGEGQPAQQ